MDLDDATDADIEGNTDSSYSGLQGLWGMYLKLSKNVLLG